jgi:hypothetical protein
LLPVRTQPADCVAGHPPASGIDRDRARESDQRMLRGHVSRHVRATDQAGGGGDVDDPSATRGEHRRQDQARQVERRVDVDRELGAPVGRVDLPGAPVSGVVVARVVDQDGNRPEPCERLLDGADAAGLVDQRDAR